MKISRRQFVKAMAAMSAASVLAACGGNSGSGSSGGKKALTFQIWDVAQKEGMEAMCAAYTQQHPEVSIEVQVTSWNEYWTKLEAAATSNQMPDIFWMHTNEILKYADNGMLADCSDIVEKDKFSEISLSNAMGSNGTLYAVPKDKDTVGLVYNKEMFDAAGVAYPDENWTWDDLVSAFGTFFLRQAYLGIPNEIAEAAYLDGCNKWQTFVKVMLPLTGPSMAALAIFTAVFAYADLMWPLICNTDLNMMTLSAGLSTLNGQYTTNFPVLMAGSLLAMIPMVILYLIFQKQFIQGIAMTGGK